MNTPGRGNKYFLCILIYQICLLMALAVIGEYYKPDIEVDLILWSVITQVLFFIPPILLYLGVTGQKISQAVLCEELNLMNIIFIVAISIVVQPLMMWISSITSLFIENNVGAALIEFSNYSFPVVLITIALIPAVFEEVTMRGIILSNYSQVDIKKAALINGFFFGILHLNLSQFFYAAVMGFIFTYLVRYTRSIYSSIISHFVINGSQALLTYWAAGFMEANPSIYEEAAIVEYTLQEMLQVVSAATFMALLFLPLFIFLMRSFINYNKKRNIGVLLTENVMTHLDHNPRVRPLICDWSFWASIVVFVIYIGSIFLNYY